MRKSSVPAFLCTLSVLCAWGCQPAQPRWPVANVSFSPILAPVDAAMGRASLLRQLEADKGVRLQPTASKHSWSVHASLELSASGQGLLTLVARKSGGRDDDRPQIAPRRFVAREWLVGASQPRSSDGRGRHLPAEALSGSLEAAMGRAWQQLDAQRSLEEGGQSAWLARLAGDLAPLTGVHAGTEQALLQYAIDRLGESGDAQAVPPLLEQLRRAELDGAGPEAQWLGQRALAALVALGDRQAVLGLIDFAQHKNVEVLTTLTSAVAALGGRTAEGWLFTLAGGHEESGVRAAAKRALADMQAGLVASGPRLAPSAPLPRRS